VIGSVVGGIIITYLDHLYRKIIKNPIKQSSSSTTNEKKSSQTLKNLKNDEKENSLSLTKDEKLMKKQFEDEFIDFENSSALPTSCHKLGNKRNEIVRNEIEKEMKNDQFFIYFFSIIYSSLSSFMFDFD